MAEPIDDIPQFDEPQLGSSENASMLVFQYLSTIENLLKNAPINILKAKQAEVEATLLRISTSPLPTGPSTTGSTYPYPAPGRAIRNAVVRCFIWIYTRGETRTLFDTIQAYVKVVNEPMVRGVEREVWKTAAWSCIGTLMGQFGSQVMSFVAEIVTSSLKAAKASISTPLMRYEALTALCKTITSAHRAITESSTKDIIKYAKTCLSDKTLTIQRVSAEILVAIYLDPTLLAMTDIEGMLATCIKSLEGADTPTRQSLSHLAAHLLAATQALRQPKVVPTTNSAATKKDGANANEEEDGNGLPSASANVSTEPPKPLCSPQEMLQLLSNHYTKPNLSRKVRVGIFNFYSATLSKLGLSFVEANYATIIAHFASSILTTNASNVPVLSSKLRYDVLLTRSLVSTILRDLIGVRMLTEQGQIQAIKELAGSYLKRWPAMMPGHTEPAKEVLVVALGEVEGLLVQMGDAPGIVQEALADPLVTLLAHPSHAVRVTAANTLRAFCRSTPLRLPKTILGLIDSLQRDLTLLTTPAAASSTSGDIHSRTLGHATALSALVSLIPSRPLYVSYDVPAKVLDTAISLLRSAASHPLSVAETEVGVAWTTIAALMSLGPGFVKPHLTQLLVLWRNALPKPTSKDSVSGNLEEWRFLLRVRESALGAVLAFLKHNSDALVTLDVARRVALVVGNALAFANHFTSTAQTGGAYADEGEMMQHSVRGLNLRTREALLRRKVFECFSALVGFSTIVESTQVALLQSAIAVFAGPETGHGGAVQAAIASSSGSFTTVWQCTDGHAYGVTFSGAEEVDETIPEEKRLINEGDTIEVIFDKLIRTPILGAAEHDTLSVCRPQHESPPPPATAVVDAAIDLFAELLPLQDVTTAFKVLTSLLEANHSPRLERNLGRKSAVFINSTVAITRALRIAMSAQNARNAKDTFGSAQVSGLLAPFLKDALIDGDLLLRSTSSESIGRLANLAGTSFLTSQTKLLVDQVVNNRDPYARAGCALTLGAIHTHVGGLAAGPLLKTTVNLLMSLSNDPHPVVHYWALRALAQVINAASLSYGPYVSSTLGMLLKLYLMESHECAGGTVQHANLSGEFPAYPMMCQIIDAVINVLGPDMQESHRTRALVLSLVQELSLEEDERICIEAIQCFQHFLMFCPEHVDIPELVTKFRGHLSSNRRPLKLASINALYQLVQKDAVAMSKLGGDRLVEDLFGMLDDDSSVEGVRNVITSWLQQTVVYNPSAWIDLCQRIMSRTTASQRVADNPAGQAALRDDEGESLNVGASTEGGASPEITSRWRTQLFALRCLHSICTIVAASGRREHLDVWFARKHNLSTSGLLVSRVPDLIRMAFTASTAYVTDIRLEGLVVLRDVIQIFASSPDPAYEDALLLEQHQAPITAALTPAFSADSTPEILSSAVHACAVFVGCGVVKDVNRMGRILKLLVTALEQSKGTGMVKLGETAELSPNASAMLRISTLSAWAELQVASVQHSYLTSVIKPHRATLATLWIATLRDYASVRVDSESLQDTSLDTYSSLGREVLLPYYTNAWFNILAAASTFMNEKDPYILAAMDGREHSSSEGATASEKRREEPTAFFFILFGLVFEALSTSSTDSDLSSPSRQPIVIASLSALKSLVRPEYSGNAMMEPTIFDEFIGLCYRMAMTEMATVQVHLIEVLTSFAISQFPSDPSNALSQASPISHCLRVCAHVARHTMQNSRTIVLPGDPVNKIKLVNTIFLAFSELATRLHSSEREDVRSVAVLLYSELLKDEHTEFDFIGPTLPALKALLSSPPHPAPEPKEKYGRLVHGLVSACLLNIDEMSGREGPIPTRKVQNNLLASVLVLTVLPPTVKIGLAVVERCCFTIHQKLIDMNDISITAAHCAKTLITAAVSGNVLLRQCTRLLIPGLIEYIAKVSPAALDGSASEGNISAISEIWKAFAAFFGSVAEEFRVRALCVLLPTMTLLLSDTSSPIISQTVTQLISFATTAPAAFKEATTQLDAPTRELLEQSIRKAVAGTATTKTHTTTKPQISLRSF